MDLVARQEAGTPAIADQGRTFIEWSLQRTLGVLDEKDGLVGREVDRDEDRSDRNRMRDRDKKSQKESESRAWIRRDRRGIEENKVFSESCPQGGVHGVWGWRTGHLCSEINHPWGRAW